MADIKLSKVKGKLQGLKDKIEKAEDHYNECNAELREIEEACDKNEGEAESFKRRIRLVQDELTKTTEVLCEKQARLAEIQAISSEHEVACKELEGIDRESDEKLTDMEEKVLAAMQLAKESDTRLQEAKQKYRVTVAEVDKTKERAETLEGKCQELESSISDNSCKLRDMEGRDAESAEKEQELLEKLEFLEGQLKEAVARAEEAERKVQPQEGIIDDLTQEHDSYADKIKDIEQEMKKMEDMVEASIDDVDVQEPRKVTDRYQVQEEGDTEPTDPELEPLPEPDRSDEERDED